MVRGPIDIARHRRWLKSSLLYKEAQKLVKHLDLKPYVRGETGGVFIGSTYPYVNIGSISVEKPVKPPEMLSWDYNQIILNTLKQTMGKTKGNVSQPKETFTFLSMSYKPIEFEMELKAPPKPLLEFSPYFTPLGPSAPLKKLVELENPKIPKKVYSLYNERINAQIALRELFHFDPYYLSGLLSAGVLGAKKKMVPTRWAITATDDTLSKVYISKIRDYPEISQVELYHHNFLHNSFWVILMPGSWEFENFEAWAPKTTWGAQFGYLITYEREDLRGRTKYAESQAGGYYASKYSVTKHLYGRKRQAKVVVIREVDEGYRIPVGVWQVRESVSKALSKPPILFDDLSSLLIFLSQKLTLDVKHYVKRSFLLKHQKTLLDF